MSRQIRGRTITTTGKLAFSQAGRNKGRHIAQSVTYDRFANDDTVLAQDFNHVYGQLTQPVHVLFIPRRLLVGIENGHIFAYAFVAQLASVV